MSDPFTEIKDASFRIGWCITWGLPCDGSHLDCCKNREVMEAVSLQHVKDCLDEAGER